MKRREILKLTLLASAGALVTSNTISATLSNMGRVGEIVPQNGKSAILTKKRMLGSGKAALKVSALSLGSAAGVWDYAR